MAARRIIVIAVALVLAGATAFYARSWMEGQRRDLAPAVAEPAPVTVEYRQVLVAERDLPAGSFINPGNVRWQRWPTGSMPASYVIEGERDKEEMVGAVVRRGIAAGEPITDGAVVKPGERGFLAAVLNPGMRAISVPVNDTSSNAGLIHPGDRVDLILTQTVGARDGRARLVSETVLEDLRVIAMGRRLSDGPQADGGDTRVRTATFEVTPAQAELVTVVNDLGRLSLSLRSLATEGPDGETPMAEAEERLEPLTWDYQASRARAGAGAAASRVLVLRGGRTQSVRVRAAMDDEPAQAEPTPSEPDDQDGVEP